MSVLFAQRARGLAVLAGLAWLLGLMPAAPVRLLVVVLVVVGTLLDAVPDTVPPAIRITDLRRRR